MFFQKFLKGIAFDDDDRADDILFRTGIICSWWHKQRTITPAQVCEQLTERNLLWHLNHYSDPDPTEPFGDHSPFISTTAGTVERDALRGINVVHPPFTTALWFATRGFTSVGYIFHGYVLTIGKQAIELEAFAEEVRDLHVYTEFLPFHPEGEIVAKISIAAPQLERYDKYDGPSCRSALSTGTIPAPILSRLNPSYSDPKHLTNLRGFVP